MKNTSEPKSPTQRGNHVNSPKWRAALAKFNRDTKRKYPVGFDSKSRLYTIWKAIRLRCYYPSHEAYERYGGRGIKVCREWRDDYGAFLEWAAANGYTDHLEIDRIDNDGDYEPSNCRWVTTLQQQSNRRNNVKLTIFGVTKTVRNWSRDKRCECSEPVIYRRLQAGEVASEAILRPAEKAFTYRGPALVTAFGTTKTVEEWSCDPRCKAPIATLYWRHRRGWNGQKAVETPARAISKKNPTECTRGHAMTDENTYIEPRGTRRCRICMRAREKARVRHK